MPGRQLKYSNTAIEAALSIKAAFHLPYRATAGLLQSILRLMKVDVDVPHYSHISRRSAGLDMPVLSNLNADETINIVMDKTAA